MEMMMSFMVYNSDAPRLAGRHRDPQRIGAAEKFDTLSDMCAIMDPNQRRRIDQIVAADTRRHRLTGFDARTGVRLYTSDPDKSHIPTSIAATSAGEIYVADDDEIMTFVRNARWDDKFKIRSLVTVVTDHDCGTIIEQFAPSTMLTYLSAYRIELPHYYAMNSICIVDDHELVVAMNYSRDFQVFELVPHPLARQLSLRRVVTIPQDISIFYATRITCADAWGYNAFICSDTARACCNIIDTSTGTCIQRINDLPCEQKEDYDQRTTSVCTQRNGHNVVFSTRFLDKRVNVLELDATGDAVRDCDHIDFRAAKGAPIKLLHCIVADKLFVILRTYERDLLYSIDLSP